MLYDKDLLPLLPKDVVEKQLLQAIEKKHYPIVFDALKLKKDDIPSEKTGELLNHMLETAEDPWVIQKILDDSTISWQITPEHSKRWIELLMSKNCPSLDNTIWKLFKGHSKNLTDYATA